MNLINEFDFRLMWESMPSEKKVQTLWETMNCMTYPNGRSKLECVALTLGYLWRRGYRYRGGNDMVVRETVGVILLPTTKSNDPTTLCQPINPETGKPVEGHWNLQQSAIAFKEWQNYRMYLVTRKHLISNGDTIYIPKEGIVTRVVKSDIHYLYTTVGLNKSYSRDHCLKVIATDDPSIIGLPNIHSDDKIIYCNRDYICMGFKQFIHSDFSVTYEPILDSDGFASLCAIKVNWNKQEILEILEDFLAAHQSNREDFSNSNDESKFLELWVENNI